ncbi:MAG: ABC transporter ATP-binding protein [bacterium]|nr:ABC transporter ATP-binding protein [bacterium]
MPLLEVKNLKTYFYNHDRRQFVRVVDGVGFDIDCSGTVAFFGESGSGKTQIACSLMGLIPHSPGIVDGQIWFEGRNLLEGLDEICRIEENRVIKDTHAWNKRFGYEKKMKEIRGKRMSLIMQGAKSALNPFQRIESQVKEACLLSGREDKEADEMVAHLFDRLGLYDRMGYYPHQLSGGTCQRVVMAMSLASSPSLIIADEPTTGLDFPLRVKIVELFEEIKGKVSLLLITHEIEIVRRLAERIVIIYAGRVIETGSKEVISNPAHPYTKKLVLELGHDSMDVQSLTPELVNLPAGCKFYDRCEMRKNMCKISEPELKEIAAGHMVRCFEG